MKGFLDFNGARWFKCDLHLHTVASKCFENKHITAQQWIDKAIKQGLNCVAITDHNTGTYIDDIKEAAKDKNITIFPGVEITCDSAKVHLLIIFDITKSSADIRDFLVRADIQADDFGKQQASTVQSIFDIADLAHKDGAIVIPAHIDEYNGLGDVSVDNLKRFYSKSNINAVQIIHNDFFDKNIEVRDNSNLKDSLNLYYNEPLPAIDDSTIKKWSTAVKYAIEAEIALLTFSDNPENIKSSKHGIEGIGARYTWIKMDKEPSLEGLRQAFLVPEFRIKNDFDCTDIPYSAPDVWIKSITISNTVITGGHSPLTVNFNPQMNTIIGGRGSGKSSILRFLRGVFSSTHDLKNIEGLFKEQTSFYKLESERLKNGVLNKDTIIEIELVRNEELHKVIASNITDFQNQEINITRYNEQTASWDIISDEGYIEFLEFEQYSQKQIYEIAQEPNALLERIDKAVDGIEKIQKTRELIKSKFLEKSAMIRTIDQQILEIGKVKTRIKDLDDSLEKLQESGVSELLTMKERFEKDNAIINQFKSNLEEKQNAIEILIKNIELPDINYNNMSDGYKDALESLSKVVISDVAIIKTELQKVSDNITKTRESYEESINSSSWKVDRDKNLTDFKSKKIELEESGISDIKNFENLSEEKAELENELEKILSLIASRELEVSEKIQFQQEYLDKSKELSQKRRDFVLDISHDDNVKIKINSFRNKGDFEIGLRKILQKENNTYQDDIDGLTNLCFNGMVDKRIEDVRNVFLNIRNGADIEHIVSGHFINMVKTLSFNQIDEIDIFLPEDEVEILYKPTPTSPFKPLSVASAGQKTTAILTFILSYGSTPLILDQPEDDLDNRLVYDLIVERLKKAKEKRQLIVVTHNANIPVNGDSEYIIAMDSESKTLNILNEGTVEQAVIKKEICDVMEGGEYAFNMRSMRYNHS